jgi:hypothetical protein
MKKLLKGEGWAEMAFALIAISVFGVWLVTVHSSRLSSLTLWEAWQSQQPAAPVERVAATVPEPATGDVSNTLAAK